MVFISSDTNIWIDFNAIHRLSLPFKLSVKYLMSSEAINDELLSPKDLKEHLLEYGLIPTELTEDEFFYAMNISRIYSRLSRYDCAALAIAKKRDIILLTGDMNLRKAAIREGVQVKGTLGIIDSLYFEGKITANEYKESLLDLQEANGKEVRLPSEEIYKRIENLKNDEEGGICL